MTTAHVYGATIADAAKRAFDLVYPARCAGCWAFGKHLCESCAARMEPATGEGRCPNCCGRWEEPLNCPRCFSWDALDGAVAAFEMDGAARKAVHALKFRGVRAIAPLMAARMAPLGELVTFDAVYAVPLHRSRRLQRGFNQAELLLRALEWPRGPGRLARVRRTAQQVGLGERDRRANMAGAFAYEGPTLDGMAIAVVDDVVTTGATANGCARALKYAGAARVVAVAFARASYEPRGPDDGIDD